MTASNKNGSSVSGNYGVENGCLYIYVCFWADGACFFVGFGLF